MKKTNDTPLIIDKKFWPLCCTQFFGAFNDNFFKNALIILITFQSMSLGSFKPEQLIALSGGIFIAPFFLFSGLAGQIADKYEKSRLINYIKILELFIMILAVVGFFTNNLSLLLFSLFLMGLQSTLFSPLKYSYMPLQISKEKLTEANALLQSSTFLAILIGTIFGGITIAIPEKGILYVNIAVISLALIGLLFSLFIPKASSLESPFPLKYNPFSSTWNLISYILPKKNILWTILGLAWFWFYGAALLALIPGYGKKVLGGNEQVVTFLLTLFSIGIGLGCMTCTKVSRNKLNLNLVPIGALGLSVFLLDLFFQSHSIDHTQTQLLSFSQFIKNPQNIRLMFDLVMIAFSGGLLFVPLMTYLQTVSPKKHLSRVIAAGNVLDAFFMILSAGLLIGLFRSGLNEIKIFLILALINLIAVGLLYRLSKILKKSLDK